MDILDLNLYLRIYGLQISKSLKLQVWEAVEPWKAGIWTWDKRRDEFWHIFINIVTWLQDRHGTQCCGSHQTWGWQERRVLICFSGGHHDCHRHRVSWSSCHWCQHTHHTLSAPQSAPVCQGQGQDHRYTGVCCDQCQMATCYHLRQQLFRLIYHVTYCFLANINL